MLSAFTSYAAAQGQKGMQLLAPGVGWVASGSPILWTTDNGGQWKNITLPGKSLGVVSIFFLDRSTGWVLLQAPDVEEPGSSLPWEPKFELAHTKDSGATWSLTQLELGVNPQEYLLVPQGFIQFTDATHGWMNLTVQSGAAFHAAILFRTVDGGKNWIWVGAPGTSGPVRFIDQQNGWVASEMDYKLWATHDGAKTWTEVSLRPPSEVLPAETVVYQLPVFTDNVHGALTVSFSASPNDLDAHAKGSRVALFVTADAGKNWKFDGVLSRLPRQPCDCELSRRRFLPDNGRGGKRRHSHTKTTLLERQAQFDVRQRYCRQARSVKTEALMPPALPVLGRAGSLCLRAIARPR